MARIITKRQEAAELVATATLRKTAAHLFRIAKPKMDGKTACVETTLGEVADAAFGGDLSEALIALKACSVRFKAEADGRPVSVSPAGVRGLTADPLSDGPVFIEAWIPVGMTEAQVLAEISTGEITWPE